MGLNRERSEMNYDASQTSKYLLFAVLDLEPLMHKCNDALGFAGLFV